MTEHDSITPNPYAHIEMRNGHPVIDPLHPKILAAYRGSLVERTEGIRTLIEFPTMHHATSWANTNDILDRVGLWVTGNTTLFAHDYRLDQPVTVRLIPAFTKWSELSENLPADTREAMVELSARQRAWNARRRNAGGK